MAKRRSEIDWYSVFLAAFSHDGAVDASSDSPATVDDDEPHFRLTRRATPKAAVGSGLDVPSASKGVSDSSKIPKQAVDASSDDSPATQAAAADVAMVSLDDERRQESPGRQQRLEERRLDVDDPGEQVDEDDGALFGLTRPVAKATVGLGPDVSSASVGAFDFSPMDEDEQGGQVSRKHCSKPSPKFTGQKEKNSGQLPLNKRKSQGHGGKRKPSVNKRKDHAAGSDESDYEKSLPSRFSERRKKQLQNSSSDGKVQEVILLDDEDMEPKEEVNREMSDRLNEPKIYIYYPSRKDHEAVKVTRSDIKCLDPEAFLSTPVIDFYTKYIERTRLCSENFRGKFYIFNTYFFGTLEKTLYQPHDFPKLRRWWRSVNIFNNAYIILPIYKKEHWSLVIICLPPKERVSEPIILHLDSLEMHNSTKVLNTVERYIEKEWHFLSIAEPAWPCLVNGIRKETVKVPQQNNGYDCGIFMLYYIEQFIKEAPARFTIDKLDMFNRSWFKPEEASSLRQKIRELLLKEFESARLDQCCRISVMESREIIKAENEGNKSIIIASPERLKGTEEVIASPERLKATEEVIASPERLKGTEEVIISTPIPDVVINNGVKRSEGNVEVTGGSMPVPDAVCEISGTKMWITGVHRRTSGTTLEPGNWCWSSGGSSRNARKKFIEQFARKLTIKSTI